MRTSNPELNSSLVELDSKIKDFQHKQTVSLQEIDFNEATLIELRNKIPQGDSLDEVEKDLEGIQESIVRLENRQKVLQGYTTGLKLKIDALEAERQSLVEALRASDFERDFSEAQAIADRANKLALSLDKTLCELEEKARQVSSIYNVWIIQGLCDRPTSLIPKLPTYTVLERPINFSANARRLKFLIGKSIKP